MAPLRQLENRDDYRACEWDLKADPAGRRYWVELFCNHFDLFAAAISETYPETTPSRLAAFRADYLTAMRSFDVEPQRYARIDVLAMDELRNELQRKHGFDDPYRAIKARENRLALALLPDLLRELDATSPDDVVEMLALGLMAGNIFDFGATAAVERYHANGSDFRRLRSTQPARPWLLDDLDAWSRRWTKGPTYEHVAFFVDNAGSDFCLGCLPLARWMLARGARVTLVANSAPALNDVTAAETGDLLRELARSDVAVANATANGRLAVTGSGGTAPLLDLTQLTDECVNAVADADLIILHGMGRAIESNFRATFSCDSLRVAVLKDAAVAKWVGGKLFDCVFRFEAVG